MKNKNKTRYGVFYRSNGRWNKTPYVTFTKYTLSREPVKSDIQFLKNYLLKSRLQIRPVAA